MSTTSWLWWPVDKVLRVLIDMSALLRRNLSLFASIFWRQRGIAPPPPKQTPTSSSTLTSAPETPPNRKDYLSIDMESTEDLEIPSLSPTTIKTDSFLVWKSMTFAETDKAAKLRASQQSEESLAQNLPAGGGLSGEAANLKRGFNSDSTSTSTSTLPSSSILSSSPFPTEQGRSGLHSKRAKLTVDERRDKRLKAKEKRKAKFEERNSRTIDDVSSLLEDMRPNYFVAFRISNAEVLENIQKVQERMLTRPVTSLANCKSGHVFKETLIPVHKLHFTLHVMQLNSDEQINKASEILKTIFDRVKENYVKDPLSIPIQGMGHFRNTVLFAKIHGDKCISRVEELSTLVRNAYEAEGCIGDAKTFKAHMTIAKMSKAKKLYKKKIRSFPREIWEQDEQTPFGHQELLGIELLSMMETDPATKYYKCVSQFKF